MRSDVRLTEREIAGVVAEEGARLHERRARLRVVLAVWRTERDRVQDGVTNTAVERRHTVLQTNKRRYTVLQTNERRHTVLQTNKRRQTALQTDKRRHTALQTNKRRHTVLQTNKRRHTVPLTNKPQPSTLLQHAWALTRKH